LHDFGKRRLYWQRGIGNMDATRWLAKAGPELTPRLLSEPYRHEFGSLLDAEKEADFRKLPPDEQDLVLHLIAAHHGRARPHFPTDESFDPDAALDESQRIAAEVPRRFARLQRRFGRWGLAYLESLLRAADYAASAGIKPLPQPAP
jgi:CRISPR-associated endonuclease/helicase Cas3